MQGNRRAPHQQQEVSEVFLEEEALSQSLSYFLKEESDICQKNEDGRALQARRRVQPKAGSVGKHGLFPPWGEIHVGKWRGPGEIVLVTVVA